MANNISVPCTETCSVSDKCPVRAVGTFGPFIEADVDKHDQIISMLAARDKIHALLNSMAKDDNHGSEIQTLLDGSCDGNHSHNHECDTHELGHHGEVVEVEGNKEHICDVESLQTLADEIGQIISACLDEDKHNHNELRASLTNLRTFIGELNRVSSCTKQMCSNVVAVKASANVSVSEDDFKF